MSITHRHSRGWSKSGSVPLNYDKEIESGGAPTVSEAIPNGSNDLAVTLAVDFSSMIGIFVASDQDILIETNNAASGSADDIWDLKANQPLDWMENDVHDKPVTADITVIYVTNNSGEIANLEIRVLQDVTP